MNSKGMLPAGVMGLFTLCALSACAPISDSPAVSTPAAESASPSAGAFKGELTHFDDQSLIPAPRSVPGELLVRFRTGTTNAKMDGTLSSVSLVTKRAFKIVPGLRVVRLAEGMRQETALAALRQRPDVEFAEPNYILRATAVPNDPRFPEQWGLENTGQDPVLSVVDTDIDAADAWNITTGSASVIVAVVDTGIDYQHPDLAANIFRNTAECDGDGIDDDGNGFVDDCHGIDVLNGDSDPMDDEGHGTHVAGTIGAVGNNGVGVSGVAWQVKLLPCKFLGADGSGTTEGAIACLEYVAGLAARGENIIATNNSWGDGWYSESLRQAIVAQRQRGLLFIAAAGNSGVDHDLAQVYPCDYDVANILCVAAVTYSDFLPNFSDFGRHSVHVTAPGWDILSTLPGNSYGLLTGTSMAAPHATGIAALLKAANPARDWRAIRNLIMAGGDLRASASRTISGRLANANGSLTCVNRPIFQRLRPELPFVAMHRTGDPVLLRALNINCAAPAGAPTVTVTPGNTAVLLRDDGVGVDEAAGDGLYSANWTQNTSGTFTLNFPNGDTVPVTFDADLEDGFPQKTASVGGGFAGGTAIHTLVGNIDDDPELEVLRTGTAAGPLYAWNHDGSLVDGWPRTITDATGTYLDTEGVGYPVLANLQGNASRLEIFANYGWGTKSAFDGDGSRLPGWPLSTFSVDVPTATDIDGDGFDELFTDDNDGISRSWFTFHRADGSTLPGWPPPTPPTNGSQSPNPLPVDLDGDGDMEIVATDMEDLVAYHLDGSLVEGFPVHIATGFKGVPAVGDVDGDGAPEIIFGSMTQDADHFGMVYVLGADGRIERTIVGTLEGAFPATATLADLDGDGIPEILTQRENGIQAWKGDGSAVPGWPVSFLAWSQSSVPIVGDVNGDRQPDVVVVTQVPGNSDGAQLRAYNRSGVPLPGFPKIVEVGSGAVPAIADIDRDGRNEIVVTGSYWPGYSGSYDTVWVFDLGGPTPHGPIEWGQFLGDEHHHANYVTGKNLVGQSYLSTRVWGNGRVTSQPAGIDCGTACLRRLANGTSITLTAIGADFAGWRGACAGTSPTCTLVVNRFTSAVASFHRYALNVAVTGEGTVASNPSGIYCTDHCSANFNSGTQVTLTATAVDNTWAFSSWTGACSGSVRTCQVAMNQVRSVTANFVQRPLLSGYVQSGGVVRSSPAGLNCLPECYVYFDPGTVVTVTAIPDAGMRLARWAPGSPCTGTTELICTFALTQNVRAEPVFEPIPPNELVVAWGSMGPGGSGFITGPGINCGQDCSEIFLQPTVVTITAIPHAGSMFVRWNQCPNASGATCTVNVLARVTVAAIFAPIPLHTLMVSRGGTGFGSVSSDIAGIDCGSDCQQDYLQGTAVALTATPDPESIFAGWSGACSGQVTTCTVTMTQALQVGASFTAKPRLNVSVTGTGSGRVSSTPGGIDCGNDCTELFVPGTSVSLTATPSDDSVFDGWVGACGVFASAPRCDLTLASNLGTQGTDARFLRKLELTVSVTGAGVVTSAPAGINCGPDCAEMFAPGTQVVLTATPGAGQRFVEWTGACTGTTCAVTMDVARAVAARFEATSGTGSSSSGGGGGGGRLDWLLLAALATALLAHARRAAWRHNNERAERQRCNR